MVQEKKNKKGSLVCMAFLALFFLLHNTESKAQNISASLSRNSILIGEQVTLQVKLEIQLPSELQVFSWKIFPDSADHLTIVDRGKQDSVSVNGFMDFTQNIILTSFDTGTWKINPIKVELKNKSSGDIQVFTANSINLSVLPVDISGMKDYHDITDILDVQVRPSYEKYLLISIIVLASLLLVFLIWKKMKKKEPVLAPAKNNQSAFEYAMDQLEILRTSNPQNFVEIKQFYSRLTEICKQYISSVLPVKAVYLTTDEMMVRLATHLVDEKIRTDFFQLLRMADAIKFAKYFPSDPRKEPSILTASQLIHYIDSFAKKPLQ
ncbi:MAG: hypothetical protein JSS67_01555 [Bacteroidetes bacterium]|nr:hypothetical protein [Bacteroidota bacterium]